MRHPPADHPELVALASELLGTGVSIEDRSRTYGRASVMWMVTSGDDQYWLKQHEGRLLYERELAALTDFAPHVDGISVPRVVFHDDDLGAMLLSDVTGSHPAELGLSFDELAKVHRLAGAGARSLHELPVCRRPDVPYSTQFAASLERALHLSEPHLDPETIAWARRVADGGSAFEGSTYVAAHMDYSPRNWLIDRRSGGLRLGVIDWERARVDHWLQDAQRMVPDDWERQPALRAAFFGGYGREPDEREERQLDLLVLLGAIGAVWWSADHGDTEFEAHGRELLARMREELGESR